MSTTTLFGWEMLLNSVLSDLDKDSDYIVAFVHWFLAQKFNLRCVGNGKDMMLRKDEVGSELLPDGWNGIQSTYALKYVLDNNIYVLLGTNTEDSFIFNILSSNNLELSNVAFHTETTAKVIKNTKNTMSTELQEIIERLRTELVDPLIECNTKSCGTQTAQVNNLCAGRMTNFEPVRRHPVHPVRNVGRSDLDPFAHGGGGMLFEPPNPNPYPLIPGIYGNLPGARFDPFGPPGANLRRPNNDHFRPPGGEFGNDFFM